MLEKIIELLNSHDQDSAAPGQTAVDAAILKELQALVALETGQTYGNQIAA